jgi:hypothetical protein
MKRFGKYASSKLEMNYKNILISAAMASAIISLFLFIMINVGDGKWSSHNWVLFTPMSCFFGGVLYIGKSFPMLRQKEEMLIFHLTPASTFEKFIYEFLERMGLFIVLFPLLFVGIANLATEIITAIRNYYGLFSDIAPISTHSLSEIIAQPVLIQIMTAGFLIFSLAFACTATFRKRPIGKIIGIIGIYRILVFAYGHYLVPENTWYSVYIQSLPLNTRRLVFSATMFIVALIALVYAYFRVKEKEVK